MPVTLVTGLLEIPSLSYGIMPVGRVEATKVNSVLFAFSRTLITQSLSLPTCKLRSPPVSPYLI